MLRLKIIARCKKDLKKFRHQQSVLEELDKVLKKLLSHQKLDQKYCDHSLSGEFINSRECHVKPDILLIYRIDEKEQLLILERIGSHAELF